MCGLLGCWGGSEDKTAYLQKGCECLRHRGPDSHGVWQNQAQQIALAHVRLAIQDLSPSGHQPMLSASQRYVVAFNGEIYNHLQLRQRMGEQAPQWRGHSDTETLLAGFELWGIEATIQQSVGMFAIAIWDQKEQTLSLVRDRFGEKPLYYGYGQQGLMFASELKALHALPGFKPIINRDAVALLMRHNYIPAPYSIYKGIYKLPPASILTLKHSDISAALLPMPKPYWSAYELARQSKQSALSPDQAVQQFEDKLRQSIQGQMLADVKLGALLSSGTDSALVVALMQQLSEQKVQTFTVGFEEKAFDEAPAAQAIAEHLGTQHETMYIRPQQGLDIIADLPKIYDEPFADSSQIPTTLVMGLAKQVVTVVLSGDAGDELMGGYNRYARIAKWWHSLSRVPGPLRQSLVPVIETMAGLAPSAKKDKLHKLARRLSLTELPTFYRDAVSYWSDPSQLVLGSQELETAFDHYGALPHDIETMMALDTLSYLPDDILVKVDRAAMHYSLEARVPMLDHRLYEYVWSLPFAYKQREQQAKWLSKQVLYQYVPEALLNRPKKGFSVPLGHWLRHELKDWAQGLLEPQRLEQQGLFNSAAVQRLWQLHLQGQADHSTHLWGILMLQSWLDYYPYSVE
ncbi:asparagine synthase (glutamine-hydrolyzing) [Brackiella oedipodis]|uniref:asparagine synthase (glutamine-hydrolyzing) n=1 Tax=Brackiella oedipodis TaxID=124225 RepID=UPI0004915244|nr:asparagine synthase (glutamine-hydrolyzing) [Brackiella oedipodis]